MSTRYKTTRSVVSFSTFEGQRGDEASFTALGDTWTVWSTANTRNKYQKEAQNTHAWVTKARSFANQGPMDAARHQARREARDFQTTFVDFLPLNLFPREENNFRKFFTRYFSSGNDCPTRLTVDLPRDTPFCSEIVQAKDVFPIGLDILERRHSWC